MTKSLKDSWLWGGELMKYTVRMPSCRIFSSALNPRSVLNLSYFTVKKKTKLFFYSLTTTYFTLSGKSHLFIVKACPIMIFPK